VEGCHRRVEGLLKLVLGEDRVVELLLLLVPEAVQHRGVREAVGVLGERLEVEHRVLVRQTVLANRLEGCGRRVEDLLLVLVARRLETRKELGGSLLGALTARGVVLGLKVAKLLG